MKETSIKFDLCETCKYAVHGLFKPQTTVLCTLTKKEKCRYDKCKKYKQGFSFGYQITIFDL